MCVQQTDTFAALASVTGVRVLQGALKQMMELMRMEYERRAEARARVPTDTDLSQICFKIPALPLTSYGSLGRCRAGDPGSSAICRTRCPAGSLVLLPT